MFFSDTDRRVYLDLLGANAKPCGVFMLGCCLMTNHVHLVAVPEKEDPLAKALSRVHGRYASYANARLGRSGHFWQSRYFSCAIKELWAAVRYVERNPPRPAVVAVAGVGTPVKTIPRSADVREECFEECLSEDRMDRISTKISYPLDPQWRAILTSLKRSLLLARSLRLTVAEFRGGGGNGVAGFDSLYVGDGLSLPYYLQLFGGRDEHIRKIGLGRLQAAIPGEGNRFSLIVVEITALLRWLCPSGGWRSAPWVRQELDLESKLFQHRRRGIENGFGRVARRNRLHYRMTQHPDDIRRFYFEYYLPHVEARFGAEAAQRRLCQLLRAARHGFLLQVIDGDDWVSGVVVYRESPERIQLVSNGLRPDRRGAWKDGSLSAATYFSVKWARSNGVRFVDFGGTRPHLDNGVYRHKSLWGAEPHFDLWHHTETFFYVYGRAPLPRAVARQLVCVDGKFQALEAVRERRPERSFVAPEAPEGVMAMTKQP